MHDSFKNGVSTRVLEKFSGSNKCKWFHGCERTHTVFSSFTSVFEYNVGSELLTSKLKKKNVYIVDYDAATIRKQIHAQMGYKLKCQAIIFFNTVKTSQNWKMPPENEVTKGYRFWIEEIHEVILFKEKH